MLDFLLNKRIISLIHNFKCVFTKTISKHIISHWVLTPLTLSYIRNTIVNYNIVIIRLRGKRVILISYHKLK